MVTHPTMTALYVTYTYYTMTNIYGDCSLRWLLYGDCSILWLLWKVTAPYYDCYLWLRLLLTWLLPTMTIPTMSMTALPWLFPTMTMAALPWLLPTMTMTVLHYCSYHCSSILWLLLKLLLPSMTTLYGDCSLQLLLYGDCSLPWLLSMVTALYNYYSMVIAPYHDCSLW